MNSVIFCHQDELNWPFDQGKVLKDRFDEIFNSVRFNKAFENIGKLYKELQGDIRSLNAEKQSLNVLVLEVESRENKLEECKQRFESTKEKISIIDKELESLKEKIKEMEQFHSKYKSIQADEGETNENCASTRTIINVLLFAEKKKMEYDMQKERHVKLKGTIENIFEGTTEELNEHIMSYDSMLKKKNDEITEVQLHILIEFLNISFYIV